MKDLLFDRLHNGLGKVMDLRSQQSAMTAGNIANTDTPNYKAKFIPFDELLQTTMGTDNMAMRRTRPGHLSGMQGTVDDPAIEEIEAPPWALMVTQFHWSVKWFVKVKRSSISALSWNDQTTVDVAFCH